MSFEAIYIHIYSTVHLGAVINDSYYGRYRTVLIPISGGSDRLNYVVVADSTSWWWDAGRQEISVPGVGEQLCSKLLHEVGVVL